MPYPLGQERCAHVLPDFRTSGWCWQDWGGLALNARPQAYVSVAPKRQYAYAGVSSAYWEGANLREVGPSRFWVAGRRVPEPNQDAVRVAPAFRFLPHSFTESAWQQEERERLRDSILQAVKVRSSCGSLPAAPACGPMALRTLQPMRRRGQPCLESCSGISPPLVDYRMVVLCLCNGMTRVIKHISNWSGDA